MKKTSPKVDLNGRLYTRTDIPAFEKSIDAFGNLISRNTTNEADIGSQYNFNPERLRLYENGSRVFVQYGENPTNTEGLTILNDRVDDYQLRPSEGSVLKLTTAERFRYIVGYVIKPSFAFALSTQLSDGDIAAIGYGEADLENATGNDLGPNADGWFFIYDPTLKSNQIKISEYRLGTKLKEKAVKINKAINIWKRLAIWINWYNVGANFYQETYSASGKQFNPYIGSLDIGDSKGPSTPNKKIEFSIKRGSGNPPITLDIGSIGLETLGDVGVLKRRKISRHSHTFSTSGVWVPILAVRGDPNNPNVYNEFDSMFITEWQGSGGDDVFLAAQAHDESKVLKAGDVPLEDSDYIYPLEHSAINSSIQVSTALQKAPDNTGTSVLNTSNYGGYQIQFAEQRSTGTGTNRRDTNTSRGIKRSIHNGDIIVIWGYGDSLNSVFYELTIEQDW